MFGDKRQQSHTSARWETTARREVTSLSHVQRELTLTKNLDSPSLTANRVQKELRASRKVFKTTRDSCALQALIVLKVRGSRSSALKEHSGHFRVHMIRVQLITQTRQLQGALHVCQASIATSEVPRFRQCVEQDTTVHLRQSARRLADQALTVLQVLAPRLNVHELTTAREDLTCTSSVSSEHTVRQAVLLRSLALQATTVPVTSTTTMLKVDAKPADVVSTHLLKIKKSA